MAQNQKVTKAFSNAQLAFIASTARFQLWRASRRQGKTEAAEYKLAKYALSHANEVCWFVAQDLALCTERNIPLFRDLMPEGAVLSYSKSERCFILFNQTKVYFKTANSSDSLRGRKVHFLICEEPTYWQNGGDIFHNILRPQLADTMGQCIIIFTPPTKKAPRGAEWVRRLEQEWEKEVKAGNTDYAIFHNTIWDSPFIQEKEKKELERHTDPETWSCEYLANYNDKQGTVYWEFNPIEKVYSLDPKVNIIMRIRGMDWGLDDYTGCAWVALLPDNKVHVYEEHMENNLDVPEQAKRILNKTTVPVSWSMLDRSCWNRLPGIECVAKRFQMAGVMVTPATDDLDGSISDMKVLMANGNITVDPKCVNILRYFQEWQWGQHEPDILAALRYGVNGLIRTGKLMRPVSNIKPTFMNHIQQLDEMERRTKRLNEQLAFKSKHNGNLPAFKIT